MKTSKLLVLAFFAMTFIVTSCNKTKKTSNRVIGEWKVTELSVDGENEDELPIIEFEDCDIYKESCFGEWMNDEGGHAEFIWQFREKAKTFEISFQADEEDDDHAHDHADEEAAEQCYNFSGVYEVKVNKKNNLEFESTKTIGYEGKKVVLKMERK
jgi:hypothetical protein